MNDEPRSPRQTSPRPCEKAVPLVESRCCSRPWSACPWLACPRLALRWAAPRRRTTASVRQPRVREVGKRQTRLPSSSRVAWREGPETCSNGSRRCSSWPRRPGWQRHRRRRRAIATRPFELPVDARRDLSSSSIEPRPKLRCARACLRRRRPMESAARRPRGARARGRASDRADRQGRTSLVCRVGEVEELGELGVSDLGAKDSARGLQASANGIQGNAENVRDLGYGVIEHHAQREHLGVFLGE